MSEGWCAACKHWVRPSWSDLPMITGPYPAYERFFLAVDEGEDEDRRADWRPCARTLFSKYQAFPETKAIACDAGQYEAALWTAPDFGCVQFEAAGEESGD